MRARARPPPPPPLRAFGSPPSLPPRLQAPADAAAPMRELQLSAAQREGREPVFEGRVTEGDPAAAGHVVTTIGGAGAARQTIRYRTERVVGNGSFGVVYEARCLETGETVAIKKVLQDRRFKNRELQIIRALRHPNVVALKHCFYSTGGPNPLPAGARGAREPPPPPPAAEPEVYLNLVLEFVPDTVYRVNKHYTRAQALMPLDLVRLYAYQMLRALAHIHALGICHRDIKPQNLLVDARTHALKLCDFGSAKALVAREPNIAYICSRYYRAPELIFGATDYTTAIDVWSVGCVAAELLLGAPLFPGESGVDQLVEIIKVLGTPSREEIRAMNPNYTEFKFPQIRPNPWARFFSKRLPPDAVDLVSRLLVYAPARRATALEALAHPFFDALRAPGARAPGGGPLPPLFDWLPGELDGAAPELRARLQPGAAAAAAAGGAGSSGGGGSGGSSGGGRGEGG